MSDLIDRQAAIDALLRLTNCKTVRELFEYNAAHNLAEMWSGGINDAIDAIIAVPPAQLGTNLAEVGTDCISRQALLDKFEPWLKVKDYNDGELNMLKAVLYEIRFMRPAQPEIIRCKDCRHWIPYDWMFSEVWQSRNINDYPEDEIGCNYCDMAMKANDFCSRGERREVTT